MLDNREIAALFWLMVMAIWVLAAPTVRRSVKQVVLAALHPKIIVPFAGLLSWVALLVLGLSQFGLWSPSLLKGTVIWFLGSAIILFFSLADEAEEPRFFSRAALSTVKLAVFVAFFMNLFVMPLLAELVLQPILTVLILVSIVSEGNREYRQARGCVNGLLAVAGFAYFFYSIYRLVREWGTIDAAAAAHDFLLPVWLTLGALPFIYLLAIYSSYERAFGWIRFSSADRRARIRAKLALLLEFRLKRQALTRLNAYWARQAVEAITLSATRDVMREFKADLAATDRQREQEALDLDRYAGVSGTDDEGCQLDQREFEATRHALRRLATAQMGWYRNRGGRYREDLLEVLTPGFERDGLPATHEIQLFVSADGQSWWAWRRTVTGWCFAIGAAGPPPDERFFDGPDPPEGFPVDDDRWGDLWGLHAANW